MIFSLKKYILKYYAWSIASDQPVNLSIRIVSLKRAIMSHDPVMNLFSRKVILSKIILTLTEIP